MAQELSVLALGLVTQPSGMGQYPIGALKVAQDIFIRAAGVMECSPTRTTIRAAIAGTTEILIPSDVEMLALKTSAGTTSWHWFSSSTSNSAALGFAMPGNGLVSFTRSRNRFLVTTSNGPIMFDYAAPTSTAERTPRRVGIPAPRLQSGLVGGLTNNAIAANTHASCIVIIRRVFPDGYELVSAASLPCDTGFFAGSTLDIQHRVQLDEDSTTEVLAGDIAEFYRTRSQSSGIAGVGGVSCDATFYLTTTHVLTAGEASSRAFNANDSTPDTGLGRQLYTNPGLGGGQATRICPPASNITCTFKGYTFLFNLIEVAQAELSVLGGIGYAALADPAAWRANIIGGREFTATWSNGSAVLTAISAAHIVGLRVGQNIRDDAVFGAHISGMLITAVGATTVTVGGVTATGAGTKTFIAYDTMVVDGDTGSYSNLGTGPPDLTEVAYTAGNTSIVGVSYTRNSNKDSFQAQSLAYFSSTFLCAPTPAKFSIAKKHAVPLGGASGNITITATNGQNYQPVLPEFGSTAKTFTPVVSLNGMAWSEEQEPDAWPPANRGRVGSGRVLAAVATRDAVWQFCTDGLWRLSGNGGAVGAAGYDWRNDLVDSTLVISGPQAVAVLRDTVFAYTARGFVAIDDNNGINDRISEGVIGDVLPGVGYTDTSDIEVRADEEKDEIWVIVGTTARVWSYLTKTWVRNVQLAPGAASASSYAFWRKVNAIVISDDTPLVYAYLDPLGTSFANGFATLQPVFGGDPFSPKQWQDVTWVFDPAIGASMPEVAVNYNGGSYGFLVQPKLNATDLRITYQVNRNAPAISASLSPGIVMTACTAPVPPKLWGLRMRYQPISEQPVRRNP